MDLPEALWRLDNVEEVLLAQIQELRCIRAEIQRQPGTESLEQLLGAEQVAQILGVDVGHVHAQARSRKIPSMMIGKYRKFSPSQLKKWLEKKHTPLMQSRYHDITGHMKKRKGVKDVQATVVRLDPAIHEGLRIAAYKEGISMNEAVNQAAEAWLTEHRWLQIETRDLQGNRLGKHWHQIQVPQKKRKGVKK